MIALLRSSDPPSAPSSATITPTGAGDPEAFAAGLELFRAASPGEPGRPPGPDGPVHAGELVRPDGPLPFPVRVGVALIRTWQRRHERPEAP